MLVDVRVLYYIGPGPAQYTIYWTGLLTKTNSVMELLKFVEIVVSIPSQSVQSEVLYTFYHL
jgi:hypothetical protein